MTKRDTIELIPPGKKSGVEIREGHTQGFHGIGHVLALNLTPRVPWCWFYHYSSGFTYASSIFLNEILKIERNTQAYLFMLKTARGRGVQARRLLPSCRMGDGAQRSCPWVFKGKLGRGLLTEWMWAQKEGGCLRAAPECLACTRG